MIASIRPGTFACALLAFAAPSTAQILEPAPPARVLPSLEMSDDLRALELVGDADSPFVVFAGLQQIAVKLTPDVVIRVRPDVVLAIGHLDMSGRAYIAVDNYGAAARVGAEVYAQALVWPADGGGVLVPRDATDVATIVLHGPQTKPPAKPFEPGEVLRLVTAAGDHSAAAHLAIADGAPPRYLAILDVKVETRGHALRIDAVLHRGAFTRVLATLERPSPDETQVGETEILHAAAPLGTWIGTVQIDLRVETRSASVEPPLPVLTR